MSSTMKFTLAACLLLVVCQLWSVEAVGSYGMGGGMGGMMGGGRMGMMGMRSVASAQGEDADNNQPKWAPNNTPQKLSVKVKDNIHNANILRTEQSDGNGEVSGTYASPAGGDKWRVTTYRAGKAGFQIEKQELVGADALFGSSDPNAAHVNIQQQDKSTDYTVKDSDLKAAAAAQAKQRAERSPYSNMNDMDYMQMSK